MHFGDGRDAPGYMSKHGNRFALWEVMSSTYGRALPLLLLIEGEPRGTTSVEQLLTAAPDVLAVERVATVEEAVRRLESGGITAVLLDLALSGTGAHGSAIERIRRVAPAVAIMLLAGAGDQALARRTVEAGANDYVVTTGLDTRTLCQLIAMMFERRGLEEQKFVERERAEITLNSIGDAVLTTDTMGNVTYLNAEAEALTGWTRSESFARPLTEVFDVTDGLTGQPAEDPSRMAIEHNRKVRMKGNYVLVGRGGAETSIEHSAAPIHDRQGHILGAVIIFRDVIVSRERRLQMLHLAEHDALTELPNRMLLATRC
jgi:PAS domain S-box-containing protein